MKKVFPLITIISFVAAMILTLSCSRDKTSAADLLRTVPSSAAGVAVISLDDLKEKCPDMTIPDSADSGSLNLGQLLSICLDKESGVDIAKAVIFVEGYNTVFTAIADNPDKFMNCVTKRTGLDFSEISGFSVADGKLAVKGTQFWFSIIGSDLSPRMLEGWLSLSEAKSYLITPGGKELAETEKDIAFNADFDTLVNLYSDGDFSRQAQSRIILSTLFDDLSRLSGFVEFTKTGVEVEISLLDSKGKASGFNLDTEKIDVKTLASIGGRGGMIIGVGVSRKMISQINKAAGSFGGALPRIYAEAINGINGTCGIVVSAGSSAMSGVLTTDGEVAQALTSLLAGDAKIRRDGKWLYFSTGGEMTGDVDVASSAELLKGAVCGFVTGGAPIESWFGADAFPCGVQKIDKTVFGLYPSGEGVKIKARVILQSGEK